MRVLGEEKIPMLIFTGGILNVLENRVRLTSRTCSVWPLPGQAATFSQIQQNCITVDNRKYSTPRLYGTLNAQTSVHWIIIINNNNIYHLFSTHSMPDECSAYQFHSPRTFCKVDINMPILQLSKLKLTKIKWFVGNHMPLNIRVNWDPYPVLPGELYRWPHHRQTVVWNTKKSKI